MAIDIKPTDVILLEDERDKQKMQIMQLEHERDMFRSKFMELDRENEQLKREIENWMDSNKYNYRGMGMAKQQQLKATESDIQRTIKDYLQWNGWFVVKIHQSLGSYKGIADLYALKNGQHVWIEVKTDRGRQSEHQRQFEQDIRDHGGRYIVARGIEDIEKYLKGEM